MPSPLERKFALLWVHAIKGPTDVLTEHRFHPTRRWKFDYAHPPTKVAVEIEGGIWSGGRHTRGDGFQEDCDKYNTATLMGWRVFRLTSKMVNAAELEKIANFIRQQSARN
ncbi:MAG: hypothetical protein ACTHLW_18105 [Verrucomicrobiota bacterium]